VKPYRVLVTGSRDWEDVRALRRALNDVLTQLPSPSVPVTVVHGDCPNGADRQASVWVRDAQRGPLWTVTEEKHPANWQLNGKRAGFIRNQLMVNLGADLCVAFIRNSSRGASNTAGLAEAAGIPTRRFTA
jgi:YspA, cpYpsA-related SLOG family